MKKYFCRFLTLFLITFTCICSIPFNVNASFQPPVLPDNNTIQAVDTMGQQMLKQMFESTGIQLPNGLQDYANAYHMLTGNYNPAQNMTTSYLDLSTLNTSGWETIYDSQGNAVSWDNIIFASMDNTDCHMYYLFNSSTGEMLYTKTPSGTLESTLNGSWTDDGWNSFYSAVTPITTGQTNAIMPANISSDVKEFIESSEYSAYMLSADHSYGVVVTNTCSADCVIDHPQGYTFSGSTVGAYYTAFNIFCNDTSMVYWSGWNSMLGFNSGDYSYYGRRFQYATKTYNVWNPMYNGGWIYYHAPTAEEYSQVINEYGSDYDRDVIYIIFVEPYTLPDTMNYSKLQNPVQRTTNINNYYNVDNSTSINNYPLTIENTSVPDYSPTYNYYTNIYNYYNNPQINDTDQSIEDETPPTTVPLLSNLEKRFPFSIPWDLKALFDGMISEREAPYFSWSLYIPYIDYTWNIVIDFSIYDTQARIFRTCFLILFIVGLAKFAYSHYFGS